MDPAQRLAYESIGFAACPTLPPWLAPSEDAFAVVFENLLSYDDTNAIVLHLEQENMDHIDQVMRQEPVYFSGRLTYNDLTTTPPTVRPVPRNERVRVQQLIDFNSQNFAYNGGVLCDLENCNPMIFKIFCHGWSIASHYGPPARPVPTPPGSATRAATPLTDFQKGVKRNITDYPDLDTEKEFVNWNEKLRATALIHQVDQVLQLDPLYAPANSADADLFSYKKVFMYTVFSSIIKTPAGIEIVRRHSSTQDGRDVYRDLRRRYIDSPIAQLALSTLHNEITTMKLTPSYNGSYESFIDKFCQLVRDHNSTCDPAQVIMDRAKIDYLHRAVGGIPELAIVRTHIQLTAVGGTASFDSVVTMYKTASANADYDRKAKPVPVREINNVTYHFDDGDDSDDAAYQIFLAGRRSRPPTRDPNRPRRPGLPPTVWAILNQDERKSWDQLSDTVKAAVIGCKPPIPVATRSANVTFADNVDTDEFHDAITDDNDAREISVKKAKSSSTNGATNASATRPSHGSLSNLLNTLEPGQSS